MDQFLKDSVDIEYGVGKFHRFENLKTFICPTNVNFSSGNQCLVQGL